MQLLKVSKNLGQLVFCKSLTIFLVVEHHFVERHNSLSIPHSGPPTTWLCAIKIFCKSVVPERLQPPTNIKVGGLAKDQTLDRTNSLEV